MRVGVTRCEACGGDSVLGMWGGLSVMHVLADEVCARKVCACVCVCVCGGGGGGGGDQSVACDGWWGLGYDCEEPPSPHPPTIAQHFFGHYPPMTDDQSPSSLPDPWLISHWSSRTTLPSWPGWLVIGHHAPPTLWPMAD